MRIPFEHDMPADLIAPIEPTDQAATQTDTPTQVEDPVADEPVDTGPIDIGPVDSGPVDARSTDQPDEAIAPPMRSPATPDAGAAQRRITMQLYSRMMTDLKVLTGDERLATDAEIDEALNRAVRALGVWQPARRDAVWRKPVINELNGEIARPQLSDAAVFSSDRRAVLNKSFLDVRTPVGQIESDSLLGSPPIRALESGIDGQSPGNSRYGNAAGIHAQLAGSAKEVADVKLGPKDTAYQNNLIPFDNDIVENHLLPSGRRRAELEGLFKDNKTDDIISKYFQIVIGRDFSPENPLRREAQKNLIDSLRLLVRTSVGKRIIMNMAYKGVRQKIILSTIGETQAISGQGSDILFNFRQAGEVGDIPDGTDPIYRFSIALAHELGHSILGYSDPAKMGGRHAPHMEVFRKLPRSTQKGILDRVIPNAMGDSVRYVENAIRHELGVAPRTSYLREKEWRPYYEAYNNDM
ncbi:hypothetical protein [Sphingomonas sp. UYAg733]